MSGDANTPTGPRAAARWPGWMRLGWSSLAALSLGIIVASVPAYVTGLGKITEAEAGVQDLIPMPGGPGFEMAADVAIMFTSLAASLMCMVLASVMFWRRPGDRMALVGSVFLLVYASGMAGPLEILLAFNPEWLRAAFLLQGVLWTFGVTTIFFLFPDGRFVPGWTRWVTVGLLPWTVVPLFLPALQYDLENITAEVAIIQLLWFMPPPAIAFVAQLYRYWRVSGPTQRQQTKVVILGLLGWLLSGTVFPGVLVLLLSNMNLPAEGSSNPLVLLFAFSARMVWWVGVILIPLSLAVAILRYRLWDMGLFLNRAAVYGVLTALLASLYFGSVVLLQALFDALTGQGRSEAVTVTSTLLIAALFAPLRQRVQAGIDRRFYRRKYDAARALAAYSRAARDEVDLRQLTDRLVVIVEDTMQPTLVSLWLKSSAERIAPPADVPKP